jgi:hypothetical protein
MDNPTTIDGVQTVCTGIGDEAQHDPRWLAFPDPRRVLQRRRAVPVRRPCGALVQGGKTLAALDCAGSWVLFKVRTRQLQGDGDLTGGGGAHRSATFSPPAKGQKRVVLDFKIKPNQ